VLWVGTFGKGLVKYDGETHYYLPPGPISDLLFGVTVVDSKVWIIYDPLRSGYPANVSVSKLYYKDNEWKWKVFNKENEWENAGCNSWILGDKKNNNVWVLLWNYGESKIGVVKIMPNDSVIPIKIEGEGLTGVIGGGCIDSEGNLWIGCWDNYKIRRIKGDTVDSIISSPYIEWTLAMASDEEDNIWVGNQGGITVFLKKGGTCRISGLPAEEVEFINSEKEGEVWVGTVGGMYKVENMSVTLSYSSDKLGGRPKDMAVDGKGRIWFAIENKGIKMLDSEGNFTLYSKKDGLVSNKVTSIEFYKDTLWIATEKGLSMFNTVKDLPPPPVEQIKVYPNPLIFSKGHTCMFFEVEKGSKIHIYTISGRLIREIEAKSSTTSWDVKNNEGKLVGTGIYLFTVSKNGEKKVGKIAVVR
jgi:hypothetical protein